MGWAKWLGLTAALALVAMLLLLPAGCASTRTLNVNVTLGGMPSDMATTTTQTVVTASIRDEALMPFVVGEPSASARAARTADGATTGSATAAIGKTTVNNLGMAGISAAAGYLAGAVK